MKASELIALLQNAVAVHGDHEVMADTDVGLSHIERFVIESSYKSTAHSLGFEPLWPKPEMPVLALY